TGPASPVSRDAVEHQDQSIKVRKSQLYEAPKPTVVVPVIKPFAEYVRDTPAAPLSPNAKTALWVVGSLVLLLFLASLLFRPGPRPTSRRHAERPSDRPAAVVTHPKAAPGAGFRSLIPGPRTGLVPGQAADPPIA